MSVLFFFRYACHTKAVVLHRKKKVKYQFWNNIKISVVLYWDIVGRLTGIPTSENWYKYQCWYVKIISQHWEIIILIGKSWEVLFYQSWCIDLISPPWEMLNFVRKQFEYLLFYQFWYIVTMSQYAVIHWKNNGIVIVLYQ